MATAAKELPGPSGQRGDEAPSTSARTYIHLHGTPVPSEWLIRGIDSHKYPVSALMTEKETQKAIKDRKWAQGREQWLAAAAAGFHCAVFAYNLAFWGSDGMAPDRYWPANSRLKMGIKPGQYGNLDGAKRIYYDNLAMLEGFK